MALHIYPASFTASTHLEVFRFYTRSTSICCNHSCKNLYFVIMQKLCGIQHVVTIFTAWSKVVSNLFAIHWKRPFKQAMYFQQQPESTMCKVKSGFIRTEIAMIRVGFHELIFQRICRITKY